jgi:acetyl-CoA carboxylase carboxyltransferase component
MMDIINRLVDNSEFEAYKDGYGQTIITGYAHRWAGNCCQPTKSCKDQAKCNLRCYLSDSADKATRFIANCNQKKIPLVFVQDVTGFMVGSKSEQGGIIKDGAKW